jgi:hypothetical protein
MTESQSLSEYIQSTRKTTAKTASDQASIIRRISEKDISTVDNFKDWVADVNFNELAEKIQHSGKSRATQINYWKALKSTGRHFIHPRKDWPKLKASGVNCTECNYLDGCENFTKQCDAVFDELNTQAKYDAEHGIKSEKHEKNWAKWTDLQKLAKNHQTYVKKTGVNWASAISGEPAEDLVQRRSQTIALQDAVLAHLFGGLSWSMEDKHKKINPPRRTDIVGHVNSSGEMEGTKFVDMDVIEGTAPYNFVRYVKKPRCKWGHWEFVLAHHKESGIQGTQILKIEDKPTVKLLLLLRKWNKSWNEENHDVFLQSQGGFTKPMTTNNLITHLKRIFNHGGKEISIDMLRHIWNTDNMKQHKTALVQNAKAMGHSTAMSMDYIKV